METLSHFEGSDGGSATSSYGLYWTLWTTFWYIRLRSMSGPCPPTNRRG